MTAARHSIRLKLSLVSSLLVGIISLFMYFYFPDRLAEQDLQSLQEKTWTIANMTAYRMTPALVFEDTTAAREAFANALQNRDLIYLVVVDDSGRVFLAYNLLEAERRSYRTEQGSAIAPGKGAVLATVSPVTHNKQLIGHLYLGMSLASVKAKVLASRLTVLLVSLAVFFTGILAAFALTSILTRPLSQMAQTVQRIASGDFSQRASVHTRDEVGQLAVAFNVMVNNLAQAQQQLQSINRELEQRVVLRTKELKESEDALRASGEQLRALNAHLEKVREEERTDIAREIHDELGQLLTALNLDIAVVEKHLLRAAQQPGSPLPIDKVQSLSLLVESALHSVRRIAMELRPDILDNLGLVAALEWQAREFEKRTGIHTDIQLCPGPLEIEPLRGTAIFRIFQEALTNVARHAQASSVAITLQRTQTSLALEIRDNGRGIMKSEIRGKQSIGILGMNERALALGGAVRIEGRAGAGTTVTVNMPFDGAHEQRIDS